MPRATALYLFLIACISSTVLAEFTITMPVGLMQWWERNPQNTHTSIAAFGEIPWGRKIMGRIGLATPENACSFIQLKEDAEHIPPILVARRGDCPFYLKAHYAQLAGAKLLLIVDNQYEEVETKLMVDSAGQGESIHIASALLARQGGEKLIDILKDQTSGDDILGTFNFALNRKDKVDYSLWLTSSSAQTFRFLREWKQYANQLSQVAIMSPHYGHFSTTGAEDNANCICGGRYCATDPDGDLPNTGADVVLEDVRQICIKSEYGIVAWWDYVLMYHESCLQGKNLLVCSNEVMRELNIDPNVIDRCWTDSLDVDSTTKCKRSALLDKETQAMNEDGAYLFPTVIINGFTYRGNLVPARGVFETICETFNTMPDVCQTHFEEVALPPVATTNHVPIVIAAIAFLIIFSLFVFCCYKRYLMREMYKQGVREVNMAVSQYIAFKDQETDRDETD